MTDEERRRTMEFILEQQAQFTVHFQQLKEERVRDRPRLARLEKSFQRFSESLESLDESFKRIVKVIEIYDGRVDDLDALATAHATRIYTLEESVQVLDRLLKKNQARLEQLERNKPR